jgi:hypothetical protein
MTIDEFVEFLNEIGITNSSNVKNPLFDIIRIDVEIPL